MAGFSSIGPTTGDAALKPDVLAVGTNVYMAGESYDQSGALFSSNRDVVADGTSFSTPLVAGAAALVKQKHPGLTPDQVRSALMTTAANILTDDAGNGTDASGRARATGYRCSRGCGSDRDPCKPVFRKASTKLVVFVQTNSDH